MLAHIVFTLALAVSAFIGFLYFRDLGDVSQMLMKVKREDTIRFIRNENKWLAIGLGAAAVMAIAHFLLDGGSGWLFWTALAVLALLYGFPWAWVHLGLRNQRNSASIKALV